jgi:hypothetical protein
MIELTTLRRARSIAAPAYWLRAISSSVNKTFWPHLTIAATAAVPTGRFAYGYALPARHALNGAVGHERFTLFVKHGAARRPVPAGEDLVGHEPQILVVA